MTTASSDLARRRAECIKQADRGPFWRDMIGLTPSPAYELETLCIHWIGGSDSNAAADSAPSDAGAGATTPCVATPLALSTRCVVFSTYTRSAAEDEFRRFRDHARPVLQLVWLLLIIYAIFLAATLPLAGNREAHIRATMSTVSTVLLFTAALAVGTWIERRCATASAAAFTETTPSDATGDTVLKERLRSLRSEQTVYDRVIVTASVVVLGVGIYVGNIGADCDDTPYDAGETTADAVCAKSLTYIHAVPIWAVVVFLRIPTDAAACGGVFSVMRLLDLAVPGSAMAWVFLQVGVVLVLAAFAAALAIARDSADRRHFASLVDAHVAWKALEKKHETLAVVVAAMVPRALAARVSAPLRWVGMPSEDALEGNTPGVVALPAIFETSARASVAVTEAVDFAAFERACGSFRQPLTGLAHLTTLFDIGTNLFEVDRGVVFGDAYVVTAGLVDGSPATALQLARFCLWQLQLDEAAMLPLRSSIATGHVTGGIVGKFGALRYHVGGEALGSALDALPATPASSVMACGATRALVRLQLAAETQGASAGVAVPPSSSDAAGIVNADDVAAASPRESQADLPAMAAADDVGGDRAWSESGLQSSTLVALHLLPDAALAREDAPSRRLNHSVNSLTRVAIRSQSTRMHHSGVVVAMTPPHRSTTPASKKQPHAPEGEDPGAPSSVTGLEVSNGRFLSPSAEAAYRNVPHSRSVQFMLPSVALCIVLFAMSDWLDSAVSPAEAVWDDGNAAAYLRLLLPLLGLFAVAVLVAAAPRHPTGFVRRAVPAVSFAACAIPAAWLWFTPGSFLRHRPIALLTVLIPCLVIQSLRGRRWYVMAVVAWGAIVHPVFAHGFSSSVAEEAFGALLGTAAFAHMWATSSRHRFAARFIATARLAALEQVTDRLTGLCTGLMPPHVVSDGIDDAFAAAVRTRVTNAPDEQSAAIVKSAVDAGPDDEAAMAAALSALSKVLGGDYGAEPADHFEWIAVAELQFIPITSAAAASGETPPGSPKMSPLDTLWNDIADCLDVANSGALQPSQEILDAFDDSGDAPNPFASVSASFSESGSGRNDDVLVVGDLRGYSADASHVRILRALHDTVVVGGPLYERAHREAAALSAANIVRFVNAISSRARSAGFEICAAFVAEEAAGGLVGRGTMRYTVSGTALRQVRALAKSLRMSFEAPGRSLRSADDRSPPASCGAALINRHFADQVRIAVVLSELHDHPLGFDPSRWLNAKETEAAIAEPSIGLTRPFRVSL